MFWTYFRQLPPSCKGLITLLCLSPTLAFADSPPTAELKVTGTIIPTACAITLTGNANYGNILASSLSSTAATVESEQDVPFTVSCGSAARVALSVTDNKAGTVANGVTSSSLFGVTPSTSSLFGLGTSKAGTNIGAYAVNLKSLTVASSSSTTPTSASVISSTDHSTWTSPSNTLLNTTSWFSLANSARTTTPLPGTTIAGTLAVEAVIDNTTNLDTTSAVTLNGSATITVQYL